MIDTDRQNSLAISHQRTLVDELGMIITQMGIAIDQKMAALYGTLYDTTQ
jgi:hypothetical protein